MSFRLVLALLAALLGGAAWAQDVPHGRLTNFTWKTSRIYPGTEHQCTVYVPAQYDPAHPACVMIFQDGLGFNAPAVFDQLIARKEMPVTIAIGIRPGVAPPAGRDPAKALPRFNRSVEYDTPDDTYARFLVEEILPEVGKTYNLSRDPNDRGLCGASSGGIAAFTAAWERPDQFRRVYSVIGSFTDLSGGDTYPAKIRKYEPRPLRVYLQDNDKDLDIYAGSWPLANQAVASALQFAGYDVQFTVGQGGHDGGPGTRLFPDVLRWLWRDYPAPITAPAVPRQPVQQFLQPGEGWRAVPGVSAVRLAADPAGNVLFTDGHGALGRLEPSGRVTPLGTTKPAVFALAVAPDGSPLVSDDRGLLRYGPGRRGTLLARVAVASALTPDTDGTILYADRRNGGLWRLTPDGRTRHLASGVSAGPGLALTPDRSLLVTGGGGPRKSLLSWRVGADDTLADAEPFFDLEIPYGQTGTGAAALAFDTQGWLYVATPAGIQICDQAGRVNGILSPPERAAPTGMTWGGPDRDILYLACGGHLYSRKMRSRGVLPTDPALMPPAPHL